MKTRLIITASALLFASLALSAGAQIPRDLTLPDPAITPGATRELSTKDICDTIWSLDRRKVTDAMKRQVFEHYDLSPNARWCKLKTHKTRFEVDHLIPRCAGGADDVSNLWAQCYSGEYNAAMKDRLEVRVCKDLCKGKLSIEDVPAIFTPDWHKAYRHYFGSN